MAGAGRRWGTNQSARFMPDLRCRDPEESASRDFSGIVAVP
jgi:hypothetical protein